MISREMLEMMVGRDNVNFADIALDFLKSELESRGQSELIPLLESVIRYYTVESFPPDRWMAYAGAEMSAKVHTLDKQQALNNVQNNILNLMPRMSQDEYHIPLN